jgi:signal transduction histidine kinase
MRNRFVGTDGDELLDAFAARAAHALGSGVGVAGGYATLLRERHAGDLGRAGAEALSGLEAGLERIRLFTDDLLELATLGDVPARREPVDVTAVARAARDGLDLHLRAAGTAVEVGEIGVVAGDPGLLERLFHHLLRGSLAAQRPGGGHVVIRGARRAAGVRIEVSDDGPALDPETARTMFDPFGAVRGGGPLAGAGVGPAICRRIAEAHGGSIRAEPGRAGGCTIVILLPGAP